MEDRPMMLREERERERETREKSTREGGSEDFEKDRRRKEGWNRIG